MQQTDPHNPIHSIQPQHLLAQPVRIETPPPASEITPLLNRIDDPLAISPLHSETHNRHPLLLIRHRLAPNRENFRLGFEVLDQHPLQHFLVSCNLLPRSTGEVGADIWNRSREFVVGPREAEFVLERLGRFEEMPDRLESFLLRGRGHVHRRHVRAVQLVPAEAVDVRSQQADVDGAVRGVGYGIHTQEGAAVLVDDLGQRANISDRTEDVGSVGCGYEFCFGGQQGEEGGGCEFRVGFGGVVFTLPPDDFGPAPFGELDPGGDVGFVVELADYDLVVGAQVVVEG